MNKDNTAGDVFLTGISEISNRIESSSPINTWKRTLEQTKKYK